MLARHQGSASQRTSCRDPEETRGFYEDFLGLRFASPFEIDEARALMTGMIAEN